MNSRFLTQTLLFWGLMVYALLGMADKKDEFIAQLLPCIQTVNHEIINQRQKLMQLATKHQYTHLSERDKRWLSQLADEYKIYHPDFEHPNTWQELQMKVDIIPPSLAIAQAAIESGWGRSQYAKKANNFFGQSCFKPGCGLKLIHKKSTAYYEAATFSSIQEAVHSYIINLNTHQAYKELRQIRHEQRQQQHFLDSLKLAQGLQSYSERGKTYVNYIRTMLTKLPLYKLDRYDIYTTRYNTRSVIPVNNA